MGELLLTLLAAALAFLGGLVLYRRQKERDREYDIKTMKCEVYRRYLTALMDELDAVTDEEKTAFKRRIVNARIEMLLAHPKKDVIDQVAKISDAAPLRARSTEDQKAYRDLICKCVDLMRVDGFKGQEIEADVIKRCLPISVPEET